MKFLQFCTFNNTICFVSLKVCDMLYWTRNFSEFSPGGGAQTPVQRARLEQPGPWLEEWAALLANPQTPNEGGIRRHGTFQSCVKALDFWELLILMVLAKRDGDDLLEMQVWIPFSEDGFEKLKKIKVWTLANPNIFYSPFTQQILFSYVDT